MQQKYDMVAEGSQIPTNNLQYKNCIAANMGDISIAATGKIFHIFSYTVLMLKLCQFKFELSWTVTIPLVLKCPHIPQKNYLWPPDAFFLWQWPPGCVDGFSAFN